MKFLTEDQLHALSTKRLFTYFKIVRSHESYILNYYGHRCCEICHEYIGDAYKKDVEIPAEKYRIHKLTVKKILDSRPDQFSHRK